MRIDIDSLNDLAAGSVFLATGGGGDPYLNSLIARRILDRNGPVGLVHPDDLPDDAFVVGIGGVGAPSVSLELLPGAGQCALALRALEEHMGRRIDALVAVEVGGANSLIPVVAAATLGLPLVDGDGMGRAFPEAQMTTFSIAGISSTPAIAVDYEGNTQLFLESSPREFERSIRKLAMSRGGLVIATEHPMSGRDVKSTIVPGTMSFAMTLGRTLREGHRSDGGMLNALRETFASSIYGTFAHLHSGKVIDIATRTVGGYDTGTVTIQSFNDDRSVEIDIRNEFLMARMADGGGAVLAMVPDLITITDFETTVPINAERLQYGQQVSVFGIGCPGHYRTPEAIDVVGPRSFGFGCDYRPLEELVAP